jgi:hypothetical protein
MAALAQPNPRAPKTQKRSELLKRRDVTKYHTTKRFTGFAAIPMAAAIECRRLTSPSGSRVLQAIMEECFGRRVPKDAPFLEETEPITMARLAELAVLEERTCQREFKAMWDADIIDVEEVKKGLYIVRPLVRTWKDLPSYSAGPVEEPKVEEGAPAEDEAAERGNTRTVVTKKPVTVRAGEKSKPWPVECGVSAAEFEAKGQLDCIFTAVVQNGVIRCTVEPKWNAKNGVTAPYIQNDLEESSRHGCHQKYEGTSGTSQQSKQRTKGEDDNGASTRQSTRPARSYECDHPRAEELAAIFDPLLLKSCGKSLSGDISCLQSACEAIGVTDHDFLVKAASDRGARPISSPKAVVAICKEIAGNFLRKGNLPANFDPPAEKLTKGQQRAQTLMKGLDMLDKMRRKA